MKHRAGLTLVEVLVAIFIVAIGLLAIMTLFPLGIMNYAQAIQDDRVAQAAGNATSVANMLDLRNSNVVNAAFKVNNPPTAVYVDPWYASIGVGALGGVIPRVNADPSWPTPYQQWFSLTDDLEFTTDGVPPPGGIPPAGTTVKNQGYFNWCYMLRRQSGRTSNPFFTDMAVVVYKGRVVQSQDGETLFGNPSATVIGPVTPTTTTPNYTILVKAITPGLKIPIRKRGWILDPTTSQFYRVINIVQNTGGAYNLAAPFVAGSNTVNTGDFVLETQTPLRAPFGNSSYTISSIVVMENVAEVIEKGFGWQP
jgi:prepilin-type N-terminal cleavage/methylation domain-containing protein